MTSTIADLVIVSLLATRGILMAAIDARFVFGLLGLVAIYAVIVDFLKFATFRALKLS